MSTDKAKEIKDHLDEWARRFENAKKIAPNIQKYREFADWQVSAYEALGSTEPSLKATVDKDLSRTLDTLERHLPLLPDYEPSTQYGMALQTTFATTTSVVSGNASVLNALVSISQTSTVNPTYTTLIKSYETLQKTEGRTIEARARLENKFNECIKFFDQAEQAYQLAQMIPDERPKAALAMRTLLDKIQGELFDKARLHSRENMTLEIAAHRLSLDTEKRAMLLKEINRRSTLIGHLSNTLKERQENLLSITWPQVIDHILIVCGCI